MTQRTFARRSRFLAVVALTIFAAAFVDGAAAQSWKMYAEQIKRDAKQGAAETPIDEPEIPESGGLLDFSGALGSDGSTLTGSAVDPEEEEEDAAVETSSVALGAAPPSYRTSREQRGSARLNDVCFVSPVCGWAVGDRGTILRTTSGGDAWEECESGTDANLFAVSFLDERVGIAVGGRVMPGGLTGRGVLLRTDDGGATWTEVPLASFPILRDARIIDANCAWIAGDASGLYPSGLFTSAGDLSTWTPAASARGEGWRSILYDPIERVGFGVSPSGATQSAEGDRVKSDVVSLGSRRALDVSYDGSTGAAWLVGDGGLVMFSRDFGANWTATRGGFPGGAGEYFDLTSIASKDGLVGAVGAPGSVFFSSVDGGETWRATSTGISTPLRKVFFADASTGWAVGDFGAIVGTRDGGATWRVERRGGVRAAALGVFGRESDAPLEAYAQLAGEEGYFIETAIVARSPETNGVDTELAESERFNEAVVETGAHGVVQEGLFRLNPDAREDSLDQILARFDAENDGKGLDRLRERLVRLVRVWRPDAILVSDSLLDETPEDARVTTTAATGANLANLVAALSQDARKLDERPRDPLRELIMRELPRAIRDAEDPTVYPEHLSICRLEPWKTRKALALCRGGTQGNAEINADFYCPSLGRAVGEIATNARAILGEGEARATTSFQTLFSLYPPKQGDKTFFDGLEIPNGGESRRLRSTALLNDGGVLARRAIDRRQYLGTLDATTRQAETNPEFGGRALSQLRKAIAGKDEDFALEYLTKAGFDFAAIGRYDYAAEAFGTIPAELYDRPGSRKALAWLLQYFCGTEPGLREERSREVSNGPTARPTGDFESYEYRESDRNARLTNAAALAESIRDAAPDAFMSPELRFPYAAAQLALGDYQGAMRFYLNRSLVSDNDLWGVRAAAEYWLRAPRGDIRGPGTEPCPLRIATCRRASGKPYLDGELESEVWDAAPRTRLSELPERGPEAPPLKNLEYSTDLGTSVAFMYDDEFLYIGAISPKAVASDESSANESDARKEKEARPRKRDGAMARSERIEILLDVDGDYATFYRFEIDAEGRLLDALWNDKNWDSKIYVATSADRGKWTLEAAISWRSLVGERPTSGATQRVAIRRIAPGVGVECWNVENSDKGENAFGILRFE